MYKVSPTFFEGFKFVRISDLPEDQSTGLFSWLTRRGIKTLKVDSLVINDCVDYDDYDYWFSTYLKKELVADF